MAELAAYVDEKMRLASEANDDRDFLRVAVLAALNLADEVFRRRREREDRRAVLATRAGELERLPIRRLPPIAPPPADTKSPRPALRFA